MAPEINVGKKYLGDQVDIYSAGVILFIMLFQNPPFGKACRTDPMFRAFTSIQNHPNFWNVHQNSLHKKSQRISDEFKELFNGLCAEWPEERWTIQQIRESRWYN